MEGKELDLAAGVEEEEVEEEEDTDTKEAVGTEDAAATDGGNEVEADCGFADGSVQTGVAFCAGTTSTERM